MKILALGDISAVTGRNALHQYLPTIIEHYNIEFIIANVDNIAHGIGVTCKTLEEIAEYNIDVYTGGNHIFDKKNQMQSLNNIPNLLRPANLPDILPLKGHIVSLKNGFRILTIHVMGQTYMNQHANDPFSVTENLLKQFPITHSVDAIFVDFHAEATAEKYAMGHFVDGRVSCIFGTHTHVPTSDLHILPKGTAYITDIGMCGCYNSVIGMTTDSAIKNLSWKFNIDRLEPAHGEATLCGIVVDIDPHSGLAKSAEHIQIGGFLKSNISIKK